MSDWTMRMVIAPWAPKYTKHGYSGSGYIGVVISENDTEATVSFGKTGWMTFHKSHLSRLKAKEAKP